jgi:hypothetical protein
MTDEPFTEEELVAAAADVTYVETDESEEELLAKLPEPPTDDE